MLPVGHRGARRHARRAFTLVELLVVVAIITILSSLLLPALFGAGEQANLSACLMNLRQMGQAFTNYLKDFDFWMVSTGAYGSVTRMRPGVTPSSFQPFREPPLDPYAAMRIPMNRFPFWYSSLAVYVNPAATWDNAVNSYFMRNPDKKREDFFNKDGSPKIDVSPLHAEVARISMMYVCPAKKTSVIGYGYNYAAPYGESILYPFNQQKYGLDYPSSNCNVEDKAQDEYCWPCAWAVTKDGGDAGLIVVSIQTGFRPYPPYTGGAPAGLPILWYGQSVHFSVLTDPSGQIGVCDTGLVVNDPVWRFDPTWNMIVPTDEYNPPTQWREATAGRSADVWRGFTRFPLNRIYTGEDADFYKDGAKDSWFYKYYYRCGGVDSAFLDLAWRPVPRHGRRTSAMFFDGRAMPVDINDVVNYEWGDRRCLFDNRPPYKPPVPRDTIPSILGVDGTSSTPGRNYWLPIRRNDGTVDPNSAASTAP